MRSLELLEREVRATGRSAAGARRRAEGGLGGLGFSVS